MLKVLVFLSWILVSALTYASSKPSTDCESPRWASPAESNQGIFFGDLILECWVKSSFSRSQGDSDNYKNLNLDKIRLGMIKKIQDESTVLEGPLLFQMEDGLAGEPSLKWDLSHQIDDHGTLVKIREIATLYRNMNQDLIYQTHSTSISASGMAGYLRSVNFLMKIESGKENSLRVIFRNEVKVERPWFALDLIFVPIARGICFEKMEEVRKKILPWVENLASVALDKKG